MVTNPWPTLESFHNIGLENEDRLSELPVDLLLLIMSKLTMNEAVRFSLVSHHCEFAWRCVPVLIFEDSLAIKKIRVSCKSWKIIDEERPRFLRRVNHVVEKHLGTTLDELGITTDLDLNWQSHVDKWAAFAVDKRVKRLEFNFTSLWRGYHEIRNGFDELVCDEPLALSPALTGLKSCLNSLCLRYVNVTDDFVDFLSLECPLLEKLCIEGSDCLTRISGSLQVKHLEVTLCPNLEKINICAKKLISLILYSHPIELHIADASSLIEMSIGSKVFIDSISYAIASLSKYFSQLVFLSVRTPFFSIDDSNQRIDNDYLVAMPNLEHLELNIGTRSQQSIEGWASLIAASTSIQKLTFKLDYVLEKSRPIGKWVGFPLKCLKTLELVGYMGETVDLELAFFVFENASMLEQVIVHIVPQFPKWSDDEKQERLVRLQLKLPQSVKLIVKQWEKWNSPLDEWKWGWNQRISW